MATRGWVRWEQSFRGNWDLSGVSTSPDRGWQHHMPTSPPQTSPQSHHLIEAGTPTHSQPSNPPSHGTALPPLWKPKPERWKREAPDSGNTSTLKLQTLSLRSKGHRNWASWDPRREERELRQGEREKTERDWETQTEEREFRGSFIKTSLRPATNTHSSANWTPSSTAILHGLCDKPFFLGWRTE